MQSLEFDWDDENIGQLALREIKPEDAEEVIRNRPCDLETSLRNGEERVAQVGETDAGWILWSDFDNAGREDSSCNSLACEGTITEITSIPRKEVAMLEELKKKTFANEAEEAAWWESHEDALADEFEKATTEGRVRVGSVAKRAALPSTTIRLDPEDIAKARVQAAERGLRYQTYLKMIIHEALRAAEQKKNSDPA